MISFESDYIEGCHPLILKRFIDTNLEQLSGYGADHYTAEATAKIQDACCDPLAQVYFLVGGTQTNQIVLDTLLAPYEGIVAPETGHIAVHEAGAIEFTGHKVLTLPSHEGKICPQELEDYCAMFYADGNHEHMVFPGVVFLTFPTELGTLYKKSELQEIRQIANKYGLRVYLDGARLGYGLMSEECDCTLADIAALVDVFYIGGTKVGALCGEAVVFTHQNMPKYFATRVKQHGGMVAKGRLLSVQFDTLFTDDLYFEEGRHALAMAKKLKEGFEAKGYEMTYVSPTNQQFTILTEEEVDILHEKGFRFSFWENLPDGRTVYRFVTSWATSENNVDALLEALPEREQA